MKFAFGFFDSLLRKLLLCSIDAILAALNYGVSIRFEYDSVTRCGTWEYIKLLEMDHFVANYNKKNMRTVIYTYMENGEINLSYMMSLYRLETIFQMVGASKWVVSSSLSKY